jgi:hypothetical protein
MEEFGGRDFGLIELCQRCETVELWIETKPNDQLVFIWLLDYLRSHAKDAITTNLILCHVDATLSDADPKHLANGGFLPSESRTIISKSQVSRGKPTGRQRHSHGSACWKGI